MAGGGRTGGSGRRTAGAPAAAPQGSSRWTERSASEYSGNSSRSWPTIATANQIAKPRNCPAAITARTA